MRTTPSTLKIRTSLVGIMLIWASSAGAQGAPDANYPPKDSLPQGDAASSTEASTSESDTITITGWKLRQLDLDTNTASRLGLSIRETPATIDQIDANEILTRGFRTVEEATVSLPGVISGGSPGDPSLFSMRGFTGEQITILHNGIYLGPANMINRPGNTFNIESIDILKGPASVLYGQGAVGGAVNIINKHPDFDEDTVQFLGSFATFDTISTGIGGNKIISDNVAIRADASYHRTNGYVDNTPSNSLNFTAALLWKPSDTLSVEFSIDYLKDDLPPYYGTPLVPASFAAKPLDILETANGYVIDERLRFKNYNVSDYRAHSSQYWPQISIEWKPSDGVTIRNMAYYFNAKRQWINAENYIFNPATQLIDRDRFFVFHKQELYGDQFTAAFDHEIAGLENKVVVGADYSHLNFIRSRGFPDGDSVDPFNPIGGAFGPIVPRVSPTYWDQYAVFVEDVLSLTPELKLVTGGRAEWIKLDRQNFNVDGSFNAGSSFKRTYKPINYRVGLVYDLTPNVTGYASYSTGKDPVGANIFLVNASQNFGLSSSTQFEAGLKADAMGGRASITMSVYDIKRKNILTQIAQDTVSNVGSQKSRGVEISGQLKVTDDWTMIASGTYVDASYGSFVDPNFGVDATGNRPANVPKWVGNIWTTVRNVAGLPLEVGGGLKYVGSRFGNTANTLRLKDYTLGIVYATIEVSPNISISGRINNVFDKAYVQWADVFLPNQVALGEPRRFEVSVLGRF